MSILIAKVFSWIARQFALFAVVFTILLLVFALAQGPKLYESHLQHRVDDATQQLERAGNLAVNLQQELTGKTEEIERLRQEIQDRREQLENLSNWFARLTHFFRRGQAGDKAEELEQQIKAKEVAQSEAEAARERILADQTMSEAENQEYRELVRERENRLQELRDFRDWTNESLAGEVGALIRKALWIVLAVIALPYLWKLLAFFVLAPTVQRASPILLVEGEETTAPLPTSSESRPAHTIRLTGQEELLVNTHFLQSSTDESAKRTKWLLDWSYPFTSLASGQFALTSIRPLEQNTQHPVDVTISCQSDPTREIAIVELPEGTELVFRPSYLVGIICSAGKPPHIRSRWIFGRFHSWIALHFRYLMIQGPVKLIFAAQRGVQSERVNPGGAGRRINSDLVVGFTPALQYSPRRAETFWAYLSGSNSLFDDFFKGQGVTLNQQVGRGPLSPIKRIWDGFFNAIGKVFGL